MNNESLYTDNIIKSTYNETDILELYYWKNNVGADAKAMSAPKRNYVRNIQNRLDAVNRLKTNFSLKEYESEFGSLTGIWGVFLLHIIAPSLYPIYDQHVYRAFRFIETGEIREIPWQDRKKYIEYHEDYVPFFQRLFNETRGYTAKEVDDALMVFGQFLSRYPL